MHHMTIMRMWSIEILHHRSETLASGSTVQKPWFLVRFPKVNNTNKRYVFNHAFIACEKRISISTIHGILSGASPQVPSPSASGFLFRFAGQGPLPLHAEPLRAAHASTARALVAKGDACLCRQATEAEVRHRSEHFGYPCFGGLKGNQQDNRGDVGGSHQKDRPKSELTIFLVGAQSTIRIPTRNASALD